MTRKRFVKLLMANGYSRNSAQRMARLTPQAGYTYEEAFRQYKDITLPNEFISPEVYSIVNDVADAFMRIGRAAWAAAEAFAETFVNTLTNEFSDHVREDE